MSEDSILREVRILRENTLLAIDTVRRLLANHTEQLENLEKRLQRLEEALTPKQADQCHDWKKLP
jgi:BMFP domain-containing protein YqiC